ADAPAAAYTFPAGSAAIAQMYVEGVVASDLNAGDNSNPPVLRIATPLAVPLERSLKLDCSQEWVPSPTAKIEKKNSPKKKMKGIMEYTLKELRRRMTNAHLMKN